MFNSDYFEFLDLILRSGDISNKMTYLEVLYDHDELNEFITAT